MSVMTKNTAVEVRHLLWTLIPTLIVLIFSAGGLYITLQSTTGKLKEDETKYDQTNKETSQMIIALQKDSNDKYNGIQQSITDLRVQVTKATTIIEQIQRGK